MQVNCKYKTRYPILLLHGVNCRDDRPVCYFGRLPQFLMEQGVHVYLGGQDAWGTIESNAKQIAQKIETILEAENCEKVNIIAHSKGGLEARYLISKMEMGKKVASLTTLSTPHYGSKTASHWLCHTKFLACFSSIFSLFWKKMGDQNPNVTAVIDSLSVESMIDFNRNCPDCPDVYYQSWSAQLDGYRHDKIMNLLSHFCLKWDGQTDGLVAPDTAIWGIHRGTIHGISHQDWTDSRKKDIPHFSVFSFYLELLQQLKELGF